MKLVPVYMVSVENGLRTPMWATVLVGSCSILNVGKVLERASGRADFNLPSTVHHMVVQETKNHVMYILAACGLPAPGKETTKSVAGTCIGRVKINKVEGWAE